jgi:ribonucleoside-diphosphate reductase alpha chain
MRLFESMTNVVSQGSTRRGHFSPYLPVEHGDIDEFLEIGTEGNPIQELTHAVTVTDAWMQAMIDGDEAKRQIWAKVIQRRVEMGYPYILFKDTVNKHTVDVYKDKQLTINHSNLCSEICLPTNENWSFVCDLSSINILHYDDWKDTDAVETMVYFLDAVMSDFIAKLEELRSSSNADDRRAFYFMEKAYNFAKENRALGLGVLGWHSYLQSKSIAFESLEANKLNVEIFRLIQDRSYSASKKLAQELGEPEILRGYGRRNTTLNAIAPTTSSSFILGQVSQSIEPIWSNCYVKDIDKMKVTIKNPFLEKILESKGKNQAEVWESIRLKDGSVQHLDFLSEEEKDIFKTFCEIDQAAIIQQAASRQHFIDQSQSLNIMINPQTPTKEINGLYIQAWKLGIKTLYYQHSTSAAQKFSQSKLCTYACEA